MSSVGNPPIMSLLNSPSNLKNGLPDKSIETEHRASSIGNTNPYLSIPAFVLIARLSASPNVIATSSTYDAHQCEDLHRILFQLKYLNA